jgi:NhaP-type Na+/H+ or K+/H+ antiporter
MDHAGASLIFALALGLGVLAQVAARHLRVPSIVLLLGTGVAVGPDGLGWVQPQELGEGLFDLVRLAVAVILFEGGLNLELRRLRRESAPIRRLVTTGAAVTALGAALTARWLMEWPWSLAALFGALVTVTGPTVIRPLLRFAPLRPRLSTILEAEGVLIDPIGAILAAVTLEIVLGASLESFQQGLLDLLLRLGLGIVAGAAFGGLLGLLLRGRRFVPEGLENIFTLGSVLILFELCEAVMGESGILAVTVAGVVVGNIVTHVSSELGQFEEQLTVALIGVLFVLLAADVRLGEVAALGTHGLATVAVLVLLVRPVDVLLSSWGSELEARERALLCWVAPRGVVAAAIASLFAGVLEAQGFEGGREFRALVFLTIAVTVVVQGGTTPLVARLLGVRAPPREALVILGAEEFAFGLAEILRAAGREVRFVDSSPGHCRAAEERGFNVVYGNALEMRTLARARLEQARAALGITANDEVNSLFAREAREDFAVPETYVAVSSRSSGVTSRILEKQSSFVLFDGPKEVERWNVRFRHDAVSVVNLRWMGPPETESEDEDKAPRPLGTRDGAADSYVVLAVEDARDGARWSPMHAGRELRVGVLAAVAIHVPDEEKAREALARLGFAPVEIPPEETIDAA